MIRRRGYNHSSYGQHNGSSAAPYKHKKIHPEPEVDRMKDMDKDLKLLLFSDEQKPSPKTDDARPKRGKPRAAPLPVGVYSDQLRILKTKPKTKFDWLVRARVIRSPLADGYKIAAIARATRISEAAAGRYSRASAWPDEIFNLIEERPNLFIRDLNEFADTREWAELDTNPKKARRLPSLKEAVIARSEGRSPPEKPLTQEERSIKALTEARDYWRKRCQKAEKALADLRAQQPRAGAEGPGKAREEAAAYRIMLETAGLIRRGQDESDPNIGHLLELARNRWGFRVRAIGNLIVYVANSAKARDDLLLSQASVPKTERATDERESKGMKP